MNVSLFNGPPLVPSDITGSLKYKLETNAYYKKLKSVLYIWLELIGALFVIGLLWITVDWVRISVTIIVLLVALILLFLLSYIFR